jgi:hypothetical protein
VFQDVDVAAVYITETEITKYLFFWSSDNVEYRNLIVSRLFFVILSLHKMSLMNRIQQSPNFAGEEKAF